MTLRPELLEILVCPRCKGELIYRERENALDCSACALRFPIVDDIPVMIVEEAQKLD